MRRNRPTPHWTEPASEELQSLFQSEPEPAPRRPPRRSDVQALTRRAARDTPSFPPETRLLVVGDTHRQRSATSGYLRSLSPSLLAREADDLDEACTLLTSESFDLVVADLHLHNDDALEDVVKLRSAAGTTPLVVLTSHDDQDVALKVLQLGAQDCLHKRSLEPQAVARCLRFAIERARAGQDLARLAHYDQLTGLLNRPLFQDRLQHALSRAERSGFELAVLFVDVDRFKTINDTLGHHAGDELLREISRRLGLAARNSDVLARLGGDEFAVLLDNVADQNAATKVARRMLRSLAAPMTIDGKEVSVTASIGIAVYPANGPTAESLLRCADLAMYRAKHRGRNSYQLFDERMHGESVRRLELEAELRRALAGGEFVLCYQPQFALSSGRLVGAEALLRWNKHGEVIMPQHFLPALEDSRLIDPVGQWVLETACRKLARWQREGAADLRVAINLSAQQLENPDLAPLVLAAVRDAGVAPSCLEIEVDEQLLAKEEAIVAVLQELRRHGVRVVVDRFGSGGVPLNRLEHLPVDVLKIDRSFVADKKRQRVLASLIEVGHGYGLEVVAQGVETEATKRTLRQAECDRVQGNLYGAPVRQLDLSI